MEKRYQYDADFLKSLRNNPFSLQMPSYLSRLDIARNMGDQIDFFKQLLTAPEGSSINQVMHYDESVMIITNYVDSRNTFHTTNQVKLFVDTPKMQKFVDIALCMLLKNGYLDKLTVPTALGGLFARLIAERILVYAIFFSRFQKFVRHFQVLKAKYKDYLRLVTEFLAWLLNKLPQYHKKYVICGMLKPFKNTGEAQELMAEVMKRLSELHSPGIAQELWNSANFQWGDFLQPGVSEREFLEVNDLDFLKDALQSEASSRSEEPSVRPKLRWSFVRRESDSRSESEIQGPSMKHRSSLNAGLEANMERKFKTLLRGYLDHLDMERFRLEVEPFAERKKAVDDFVRCAIQSGIEFGIQFRRPIGQLLSYLIAFGLMTEEQRLEGLKLVPQSLLHKREASLDDKDAIKRVISAFMVNSEEKASALWESKKIKLSDIFDPWSAEFASNEDELLDEDNCDEAPKGKTSPTLAPFLRSNKVDKTAEQLANCTQDRKAIGIVQDYLTDLDLEEAIKDYQSCYDTSSSPNFVSTVVNHAIQDEANRNELARLLLHFVFNNIIKPEQFRKGWLNTLCCAKDKGDDAGDFLGSFADLITVMFDEIRNCKNLESHISKREMTDLLSDVLDHLLSMEADLKTPK